MRTFVVATDQKERQVRALNLFKNTLQRLRESVLGKSPDAVGWLQEHQPDLMHSVDDAEATVDEQARRYILGEVSEVDFKAAGKSWFAAWRRCADALPPLEQGA